VIALEVAHNADAFNCETCQWGRHCDERNPAPFAKWVIRGVLESKTCLLPMVTPQSKLLLRLHEHYENGVLPYAGGILDQPNYFTEMMETISARERVIRAEVAERREAEQRRNLAHMPRGA
jgi:hypothetical protein